MTCGCGHNALQYNVVNAYGIKLLEFYFILLLSPLFRRIAVVSVTMCNNFLL